MTMNRPPSRTATTTYAVGVCLVSAAVIIATVLARESAAGAQPRPVVRNVTPASPSLYDESVGQQVQIANCVVGTVKSDSGGSFTASFKCADQPQDIPVAVPDGASQVIVVGALDSGKVVAFTAAHAPHAPWSMVSITAFR
jgi:hypothetical protein